MPVVGNWAGLDASHIILVVVISTGRQQHFFLIVRDVGPDYCGHDNTSLFSSFNFHTLSRLNTLFGIAIFFAPIYELHRIPRVILFNYLASQKKLDSKVRDWKSMRARRALQKHRLIKLLCSGQCVELGNERDSCVSRT